MSRTVGQPRLAAAHPHDPYPSRQASEPAILPRQDPCVHAPHGARGPLGAEQVRFYTENGFLEIDGLFKPSEVIALQQEMMRLWRHPERLTPETLVLEPEGRALRSIFRVHGQSRLLGRLANDSRLVDIARFVLGDEVYVHQSRLNYKPGFAGKEFYWHSDFETWHVEDGMPRMRALSMSIALTENTGYNGPLMVIPGSHRHYVSCVGATPEDHYRQSLRRQEYGVPDRESLTRLFEEGGIHAPVGPPGRIVLFDCNLMHGSNGNISPLPRSNVFLVYNSLANRLVTPYGGRAPRPEFVATRRDLAPCAREDGLLH